MLKRRNKFKINFNTARTVALVCVVVLIGIESILIIVTAVADAPRIAVATLSILPGVVSLFLFITKMVFGSRVLKLLGGISKNSAMLKAKKKVPFV